MLLISVTKKLLFVICILIYLLFQFYISSIALAIHSFSPYFTDYLISLPITMFYPYLLCQIIFLVSFPHKDFL